MVAKEIEQILFVFINKLGKQCPKSIKISISVLEKYKDKLTPHRTRKISNILVKSVLDLLELKHSNELFFKKENLNELIENLNMKVWILKFNDSRRYMRAEAIDIVAKNADLKESIPLIEKMLNDKDSYVRKTAIKALIELGSENSIRLIEKMLKDSDIEVREEAEKALTTLSERVEHHKLYIKQNPKLFEAGKEKSLGYIKRKEFEKTGSKTVLLGSNLTGKVIIRIINEEAFFAWRRAFEAKKTWKEIGFDYIPVEPILTKHGKLRAYKTKDGMYRVSTKIVGESFATFLENPKNSKFREIVEHQKYKIYYGLKKLNIEHGHLHYGNFCVEFHGEQPRVYVIDFDRAKIID